MFNQVIENAKILRAGLFAELKPISKIEGEIDEIRNIKEVLQSGDGVQYGRRKHDKVLAQQAEHKERCRQEVIKTLKCRA